MHTVVSVWPTAEDQCADETPGPPRRCLEPEAVPREPPPRFQKEAPATRYPVRSSPAPRAAANSRADGVKHSGQHTRDSTPYRVHRSSDVLFEKPSLAPSALLSTRTLPKSRRIHIAPFDRCEARI